MAPASRKDKSWPTFMATPFVAEHGDIALRLAGEPVELILLVAGQPPCDTPKALPNRKPREREPSREPSAPDVVLGHTVVTRLVARP